MPGTAPATPLALGAAPSLAGRHLGRYQVLCQLAAGGMAGVYVARALAVAGFERLVAVKVLHPHLAHEEEFISMFLDEARLAARIRHPNVVPTLDISDTEGDGFFLVMEYIEGHHLGALLQQAAKDNLRVPPSVIVRVVLDALGGLSAAHTLVDERGAPLNLVHRDVSPHNIMVGTDGVSRLTDFGVAKAEVRLTSTRDGQFKGKLAYMAPEHASTGQADQRSDLFAMGVILWEGLTGRRLFRADTNAQTLQKILVEEIPAPSSVRDELAPFDALCAKAMAREPEDRFQSADEFAAALEDVAAVAGGVATPRQVGEVVRRLAADKLTKEKARIQEAIAGLGQAGMAAMPVPRGASEPSMPSMPSRSRSLPAGTWQSAVTQTGTGAAHGATPRPSGPPAGPGREPTGSRALGAPSPFDGLAPEPSLALPAAPDAGERRRSALLPLTIAGAVLVLAGVGVAAVVFGARSGDAAASEAAASEATASEANTGGASARGHAARAGTPEGAGGAGDPAATAARGDGAGDPAGAHWAGGIAPDGAGGRGASGAAAVDPHGGAEGAHGAGGGSDTGTGAATRSAAADGAAAVGPGGAHSGSGHGAGRRRRDRDADDAVGGGPAVGGGGAAGGGGGSVTRRHDDDDLLINNPYRR
jgi:serine/threonine-protein kinase